MRYQGIHLVCNIQGLERPACRPNVDNVRVKTGLERDLMEGWEDNRVVSSLIWMPSEHPEVMVWLLVGVRAHGSTYGDAMSCSYTRA